MNDQAAVSAATTGSGEDVEPFEPLAERVISDVETLKALSDPVRLRILETMVTAADEAWTVKRLAKALGSGTTKLYHHIDILEERDLIRVAGTRVVSGIIETSYRIARCPSGSTGPCSRAPAPTSGAAFTTSSRSSSTRCVTRSNGDSRAAWSSPRTTRSASCSSGA